METTAEELLALVAALNPFPAPKVELLRLQLPQLELDDRPKYRPSRRTILIAGLCVAGLLASGVAIAEGVNPLAGIGSANHPRQQQDILPAAAVLALRPHDNAAAQWGPGSLLPDTSRFVGRLPSGRKVYVAATTTGVLEIIVTNKGKLDTASAVPPLSPAMPITITTSRQNHRTPPISYGIVRNGITSVSFRGGGREHTVPVEHNVWAYEGDSNALESITVHYADGRTQTITH